MKQRFCKTQCSRIYIVTANLLSRTSFTFHSSYIMGTKKIFKTIEQRDKTLQEYPLYRLFNVFYFRLFHSAIVRPVRQTRLSAAVWFDGWPECSGYPRPSIFGLFTLPRPRQQLSLGRFQWNWPSFLGLHGFSLHHLHVMVDITTYHKRHHEATLVKPQNEDASREFEKVEKKATKAVICLQEVS